MGDKSLPFSATIRWIKKETRDTATYALRITDEQIRKKYSFRPGQFNMISIPGIGEAPISISSAPSDYHLLHTVRVAGDVTAAMSQMHIGSVLALRGPFGKGWPLEETEDKTVMIIAGGLGIAPLRSAIRQIVESGGKRTAGRPARIETHLLLYGAKTPKDVIFRDEFPRYKDIFNVFLTVDKADPEEHWRGEVGLIPLLLNKVSFDPLNTVVFLCGPEVMMQLMTRELMIMGIPAEKVFVSMERNMNCGMGLCGHCMFGPKFICKDGPVFRFSDIEPFWAVREI